MELKVKSYKSEPHSGYGAGSGSVDTTIYYCPCGKGEIEEIRDNIPGFRDTDWILLCDECRKKYHFDEHNHLVSND